MIIPTNRTRASGAAATARGSIAIPDVTKKMGISSPKARPLSFVSSCSSPRGSAWRRMKPAAKAPSTTSSSKTSARTLNPTSSSTVSRTVVCPVVSEPARMRPMICDVSRRIRRHGRVTAPAISANMITATTASAGPAVPSSTAIAMIGPSSPKAPWFITARPTLLPSSPPSLRIGSRVPRAVEQSAMARAVSAWIRPVSPIRKTTARAIPRQMSQTTSARRPDRPVSSEISIS